MSRKPTKMSTTRKMLDYVGNSAVIPARNAPSERGTQWRHPNVGPALYAGPGANFGEVKIAARREDPSGHIWSGRDS